MGVLIAAGVLGAAAVVVLSAAGALCVVVVAGAVEAAIAPVFASEPDSAFNGVPEPGAGTVLPVGAGADGEFSEVVVGELALEP